MMELSLHIADILIRNKELSEEDREVLGEAIQRLDVLAQIEKQIDFQREHRQEFKSVFENRLEKRISHER